MQLKKNYWVNFLILGWGQPASEPPASEQPDPVYN